MQATRRTTVLGLGALALSACAGLLAAADGAGRSADAAGSERRLRCLGRGLPVPRAWPRASRAATFDTAFAQAGFLPGVIERDRNQTEFTRSLEDYLAIAASDERVTNGRSALRQYGPTLSADRGALRRRAAGRHRRLGHGKQLRHAARQRAGGLGSLDARLRGPRGAPSSSSSSSRPCASCRTATSRPRA